MQVTQCLTDGGLPDAWNLENLRWLAQAHQRHAAAQIATRPERSYWHRRWAAFVADILETNHVQNH